MKEEGSVLIITLWILTILTLLALSFSQRMKVEIKLTGFQLDSLRALFLARAGVNYAIARLKININDYDALTEDWAKKEEVNLGKGKFIIYIEDEERRINLNTASKITLNNLGLGEEIICPIIDWIDEDEEITPPYGAENEYYQGINSPYHCKNAPFESVEELLMLKNISPEILYGEKGISQLLTVYTNGVVNINTADEKVLASLPGLDEELARNIVDYRRGLDGQEGTEDDVIFKNPQEITKIIGIEKYNQLTTKSNSFKISSTGIANRVIRRITTGVDMETGKIQYWREN